MAYDEQLSNRIRDFLRGEWGVTEKRMFGGLAFLIGGNMAVCAISHGGVMLRIDPAETESLVRKPDVRRFEMRGRELDGWLHIAAEAVRHDDDLRGWVRRGTTFARTLPPKQPRRERTVAASPDVAAGSAGETAPPITCRA